MNLFTMRSAYVAVLVAGAFAARGPGPAALAQERHPAMLPTESVFISLTDASRATAALGRAAR